MKSTPLRTYAGQDLAERVAERRRAFVQAGIEQFATIGYHSTTIRTLTAAAGLTNRYFYESFNTMEDLLVAAYEHLMASYRERLLNALAQAPDDVEQRIRVGVRCYFEQMRDPRFARVTQVEVVGVSPRVDAVYVRSMREFGALIAENITKCLAAQQPETPRNLDVIGVALAGAISITAAMWMRSHYRESIDAVTDAAVTIVLGTTAQLARGK